MRPCPRSRFLELARGAGIALAILVISAARPAPARAQACCSGGSVVTPTRLAGYEDCAVGLQTRARSTLGSFGPDGRYVSAGSEQVLEQDLAASVRLGGRAQVGALLPMMETHRSETGIDEWGGGIGDLALSGRHDLLAAAGGGPVPGGSL